jgi:hypothetical protein
MMELLLMAKDCQSYLVWKGWVATFKHIAGNSLTLDVLASSLASNKLCATHVLVCYPTFHINKVTLQTGGDHRA